MCEGIKYEFQSIPVLATATHAYKLTYSAHEIGNFVQKQ